MIIMKGDILIKFARKGIILSPEALNLIESSENPLNLSSEIIVKLKSGNYTTDMVPIDVKTLESMGLDIRIGAEIPQRPQRDMKADVAEAMETPIEAQTPEMPEGIEISSEPSEEKGMEISSEPSEEIPKPSKEMPHANNPGYASEYVEKIEDTAVSKEVETKYKRNLTESKVSFDRYKVLMDTSNKSYTSGEIGNLIEYFQNRYKKLSDILSKRPELRAWQKINEITNEQTDLNLIVMITDIRSTKNGHYLLEVEDDTGSLPVLVSKDNEELVNAAKNLMKDEVIGIIAQKRAGQSENRLAICTNIIDPGVPRKPRKEVDFATVFTSDIHIGSSTFLEDAFVRFTKWINGDFGSEEQRETANNVKYMIVGGDIVDGIGVYPNQDKELAIKDITAQYDEAARLLGDIRSDIKIIITPGNHDASRVAEPQPAVPEKYAKSLYKLNNVEFLSNPSMVSLDGLEVLIYHGRGIDDMVMGSNDFSHERNDLVMKEFLRKRHLAPLYGERTPLASELEDHLVIDRVPDVLHTGHVHINTYTNYNGIHCINSGTFQTQTEFQKIYNIMPTPAEVPIIDVGGNYKQYKFIY